MTTDVLATKLGTGNGIARHLLSHNQNGFTIQSYCAIITCLLISLQTGREPTNRTQEMLCYLMMGWATPDDVAAHVAKLKNTTNIRLRKIID